MCSNVLCLKIEVEKPSFYLLRILFSWNEVGVANFKCISHAMKYIEFDKNAFHATEYIQNDPN